MSAQPMAVLPKEKQKAGLFNGHQHNLVCLPFSIAWRLLVLHSRKV
jgi:hypothetical protein